MDLDVAMVAAARRSAGADTGSLVSAGGWSSLLADEERHIARHGFGSGVVVVSFVSELLRRVDEEDRALIESAILAIIEAGSGWADRRAVLAPGRVGIVVVSVDGTLALASRARHLYSHLGGRGVTVDMAYALRRDRGGLAGAAARADAALDTAMARRDRPPAT